MGPTTPSRYPLQTRPRMKRSCGGPLSQGHVEAEFAELSGQASGETGSLGALEVIGSKIVVLRPALQHVVDCVSIAAATATMALRGPRRALSRWNSACR